MDHEGPSVTTLVRFPALSSRRQEGTCRLVFSLRNQFSLYVLLSYSVNERLSKLQGLADDRVDVPALPSG